MTLEEKITVLREQLAELDGELAQCFQLAETGEDVSEYQAGLEAQRAQLEARIVELQRRERGASLAVSISDYDHGDGVPGAAAVSDDDDNDDDEMHRAMKASLEEEQRREQQMALQGVLADEYNAAAEDLLRRTNFPEAVLQLAAGLDVSPAEAARILRGEREAEQLQTRREAQQRSALYNTTGLTTAELNRRGLSVEEALQQAEKAAMQRSLEEHQQRERVKQDQLEEEALAAVMRDSLTLRQRVEHEEVFSQRGSSDTAARQPQPPRGSSHWTREPVVRRVRGRGPGVFADSDDDDDDESVVLDQRFVPQAAAPASPPRSRSPSPRLFDRRGPGAPGGGDIELRSVYGLRFAKDD